MRLGGIALLGCLVLAVSCGDDDDDVPGGSAGTGAAGTRGSGDGGTGGGAAGSPAHAGMAPSAEGGAGGSGGDMEPSGAGAGGRSDAHGGAGADAGGAAGSGGGAAGGGEGGAQHDGVQLANCEAIDLSADGETVLATRGVWSAATGWVIPPDLPGGTNQVIPRALSRDGKVVFGNASSALGMEMFRWVVGTASSTGLGVLNWPLATNADGSVSVGHTAPVVAQDGATDFDLFRWTSAGGFADLDPAGNFWDEIDTWALKQSNLPRFFSNAAGDGGLIGAGVAGSISASWTFRWSASTSVVTLSHELSPDGMSSDGKVGAFRDPYQLTSPVFIKDAVSFADIGKPKCASPVDEFDPKCLHVHQLMTGFDAQGSSAVGFEDGGITTPFVHWKSNEDARDLVTFLADQGVALPRPKGVPRLARLSDDGRTVLGSFQPDGQLPECFLVTY